MGRQADTNTIPDLGRARSVIYPASGTSLVARDWTD